LIGKQNINCVHALNTIDTIVMMQGPHLAL